MAASQRGVESGGFGDLKQVRAADQSDIVNIRVATVADVGAITIVINTAFHRAESFFVERDRIDSGDIRSLMEKGRFLVADNHDAIAGCVYVEVRGERGYLGLLAVAPQLQGEGLGSKLMNAAEAYCVQSGCRFMDLRIVNLRTENQAFYVRRGYKEAGTEPFPSEIPTKLPCHFVKMSKPLA